MKAGVSKSGSPAAKLTTSTPSAWSCLARVVIAMVALGDTASMRWDNFMLGSFYL
jgi:hypothetical protein